MSPQNSPIAGRSVISAIGPSPINQSGQFVCVLHSVDCLFFFLIHLIVLHILLFNCLLLWSQSSKFVHHEMHRDIFYNIDLDIIFKYFATRMSKNDFLKSTKAMLFLGNHNSYFTIFLFFLFYYDYFLFI